MVMRAGGGGKQKPRDGPGWTVSATHSRHHRDHLAPVPLSARTIPAGFSADKGHTGAKKPGEKAVCSPRRRALPNVPTTKNAGSQGGVTVSPPAMVAMAR